jgi:hypothetical protein
MTLYKLLDKNGYPAHGGHGVWNLPQARYPGEWMPAIEGKLVVCENGYHLVRFDHVLDWAAPELYEAEFRGDCIEEDDKIVVRQARLVRQVDNWSERTLRLFAVWCAWEALALVDRPDPRTIDAVDVAEKYANGNATDRELSEARAAAGYAAWTAARTSAWTAASAAARDAARTSTWTAARTAAWAAASTAARRTAAWDTAAHTAAWDAARKSQVERLASMLGV